MFYLPIRSLLPSGHLLSTRLHSVLDRAHVVMAYSVLCISGFGVIESKVPRDRTVRRQGDESVYLIFQWKCS